MKTIFYDNYLDLNVFLASWMQDLTNGDHDACSHIIKNVYAVGFYML